MHPKDLLISDFTYPLPDDRIAKYPLEERDSSKLLVYKGEESTTSSFKNITDYLPADSLLVFNNTKVVEARILFQKPTGGVIEIFCLEPHDKYGDITTAMLQKGKVWWKCLVGGASKWKHGMKLTKGFSSDDVEGFLEASIAERLSDCFVIEMTWQPEDLSFAEILHKAGVVPLPPYLHRESADEDKERYQTIYAVQDGSVAAPTAGLHFTERIFEKLEDKNIKKEFVTLHVGAGTFKPVKAEKIEQHEMHFEFIDVSIDTIKNLIAYSDKCVIAVGTTSLRTIESLYWMGLKALKQPGKTIEEISVYQWDPYEIDLERITTKDALESLASWMTAHNMNRLVTKTQILIAPSYRLKVANAIITNFHQPQSTLLLLVSAIIGNKWKEVYQYALDNDFRFLSYGDSCLLWQEQDCK